MRKYHPLQLMNLNEMENQLEDTRAMLSQNAAQLEERDQHIAELQERLVSQVSIHQT